jgi:hypothetical protein
MTPPVLDPIDLLTGAAWLKIQAHYEARLERLRKQLESPAKDERETAYLRGQIKECRNVLALGDLDPANVTDAAE